MRIPWRILIVDDEPAMRDSLTAWLVEDGHEVATAENGERAVAMVREADYNLCFMDLKMPGRLDGIQALREINRVRPDTTVVIITAFATVDTAIEAMKVGAYDYIVKPFNPEEISILTRRILEMEHLRQENVSLRRRLARRLGSGDIVAKSPAMRAVRETIRHAADIPAPVLVRGEKGVGKERMARAIHEAGRRSAGPFVRLSCSAQAPEVLAAELFATEENPEVGKIVLAAEGTLFLEDVGALPEDLVDRLIEAIEAERAPRIIGSTTLSASEAEPLIQKLFTPFAGVSFLVPPLRKRLEDLPLLIRHLIEHLAAELRVPVRGISAEAIDLLLARDWPGNVRELENALERAMATCEDEQLDAGRFDFLLPERPAAWEAPVDLSLAEIERQVIPAALSRAGGDLDVAAKLLGIERAVLQEKLARHGIPVPERGGE